MASIKPIEESKLNGVVGWNLAKYRSINISIFLLQCLHIFLATDPSDSMTHYVPYCEDVIQCCIIWNTSSDKYLSPNLHIKLCCLARLSWFDFRTQTLKVFCRCQTCYPVNSKIFLAFYALVALK